ncbi:MAG: hypothetical protein PUG60_09230 [Lachnospiraceae bacterium]|nr:hypothetical protein [Lachnospiraceae bacterium]MDY4970818.1 hypothetical protein [Lachnospiraceae bacterium]
MKIYNEKGKMTGAACNCCGKIMLQANGMWKEDFASFRKEWGYFSDRDGMVHRFDLCEACYNKMIEQFRIPVEEEEAGELL